MTAPPTDERLDWLEDRARFCRSGCDASGATGELAAEIRRLRYAHASLAAAFDGVCGERDQRARETEGAAEKLAEMTRCRDAAIRYAEREHVEIEFDLDGNLRDGLAGITEWEHAGEPDHSPDWLIDAVVRVVRPELARLTEQRDAALSLIDASAGMFGATREQLIAADEEHPTPELVEVGRRVRDQITAWLAEHDTAGGAP